MANMKNAYAGAIKMLGTLYGKSTNFSSKLPRLNFNAKMDKEASGGKTKPPVQNKNPLK